MSYKYIIIGSGPAAISAAQTIFENDPKAEISIYTAENTPYYYRPKLIDYIAGKNKLEDFIFYSPDWYKSRNINLNYNKPVKKIDAANKLIILNNAEKVSYDKLLIASGGEPFVPEIFLTLNPLTLRNANDADKIIEESKEHKDFCIIGGGLLGLELAGALINRKVKINVIETASHPLPRQLDSEGGDFLKHKLSKLGINLYTSSQIEKVEKDHILLKNGTKINYSKIIVSAGIKPAISFLAETGIEIKKGIVVNEKFETNIKNIYASGDVCEFNGDMYGSWMPAIEQGKLSGYAMSGKEINYKGSYRSYRLKILGIDLVSAGKISGEIGDEKKIINKDKEIYKKAFLSGNNLAGFILYGDTDDETPLTDNISKDFRLSEKYFTEKEKEMKKSDRYICDICGYLYDSEKGDIARNVEPGTLFNDLPSEWICPICGGGKDKFSKM